MILPDYFFEFYPDFEDMPKKSWEFHTLRGFAKWVTENKPTNIEITEKQFWNFTLLQPLNAGEERYWTTFHGIPLLVLDMTNRQKALLRLMT